MISKVISLAATSVFVGVDAKGGIPGGLQCAWSQENEVLRDSCIVGKFKYEFSCTKSKILKSRFFKTPVPVYTLSVYHKGQLMHEVGPLEKTCIQIFYKLF